MQIRTRFNILYIILALSIYLNLKLDKNLKTTLNKALFITFLINKCIKTHNFKHQYVK